MNVLILHAHPEPKSFSSSLKDIAVEHFENNGDKVNVRDLYAMKFNPIANAGDFKQMANPDYLDIMKEQNAAYQNGTLADDIQVELDALLEADFLLLNFPLWWSSFPAILKGWFDRVLAFGLTYHPKDKRYETGVFLGKKAMCCICIGGRKEAYEPGGEHIPLDRLLDPIHHQILYYTGMTVLPQFTAHRPHLSDEETLKGYIKAYKNHLKNIANFEPIYRSGFISELKKD